MFTSKNFKEENENSSEMVDFDKETVENFLEYIYDKGNLDLDDFTPQLLLIAEKYNVKELLEECEQALRRLLDSENVFEILKVAFLVNQNFLMETIREFLFENPSNFFRNEWTQLVNAHPTLCDTLREMGVNGE